MKTASDRLPPSDAQAERAALGCILIAPSAAEVDALLAQLSPRMFYDLRHQTLFLEAQALRKDNHILDLQVFANWLTGRKQIEACGGLAYVAQMHADAVSVAQFGYWIEKLKEMAMRRWLLAKSAQIAEMSNAETVSADALRAELGDILDQTSRLNRGQERLIEVVTIEELKAYKPDPKTFLIGENILCLGEWAVLAGMGGVGKSTVATSLALAGARGAGTWMGMQVRRPFRTFILQSEGSMVRLKSEVQTVPSDHSNWVRFSTRTALMFSRPEFRAELRRIWEAWNFDVLVIDNWLDMVRDDTAKDYLEALDNIRASLPYKEQAPAVLILAHLRKARPGEKWTPKVGRELVNEVTGSMALTAKARTVWAMQHVDPKDEKNRDFIWECTKCNNDEMPRRTAWSLKPVHPDPIPDFDFKSWMNQEDEEDRKTITERVMEELFQSGQRLLSRKMAVAHLVEMGFASATAYRALSLEGKFGNNLNESEGLLSWKTQTT